MAAGPRTCIVIICALLAACSLEGPKPKEDAELEVKPEDDTYSCGGETTESVARGYFRDLSRAIEVNAPAKEFDRFVAKRFSTYRNERYLVFIREEVSPVTPTRISREDWIAIAELGFDELWDGGYRGCMLRDGKVWFEGDGSNFGLRAIQHDIDWEE